MTDAVADRIREVAADIFDVPAATIGSESSPSTIEAWDSVAHLNMILALEDEFGIKFDPEEMEKMQSIGQIAELIHEKTRAR